MEEKGRMDRSREERRDVGEESRGEERRGD